MVLRKCVLVTLSQFICVPRLYGVPTCSSYRPGPVPTISWNTRRPWGREYIICCLVLQYWHPWLACFSWAVHFRMMAQTVILSVLIELLLTFTFNVSGSKVMFSNTWAVKIRDGGLVVVGNLARKHGFVNETQVLSTSYNCKLFI